jgi:putative acetyltransferase
MSAVANPQFALRPFLPADAPVVTEIFRAAIVELTADDYSEAQQEAWAAAADDEAVFAQGLGKQLTLVVTMQGSPVGFASLKGNETLDMLYVHPGVAGHGAAAMLADALERLTARGFFEKRGYVAQQRNSISVGDEWLANTTLSKALAGGKA